MSRVSTPSPAILRRDLLAAGGAALVGLGGVSVQEGLEDRLRSVREFGAVGDGVTDDTAKILDAMTAAGSDGILYFPPGFIFKVSVTLPIDCYGIIGNGAEILFDLDGETNGVDFSGSYLEGLRLVKSSRSTDAVDYGDNGGYGLRYVGPDRCYIHRLELHDFVNGVGASIAGASGDHVRVSVDDSHINAVYRGVLAGRETDASKYSIVTARNVIIECQGQNVPEGSTLAGGDGVLSKWPSQFHMDGGAVLNSYEHGLYLQGPQNSLRNVRVYRTYSDAEGDAVKVSCPDLQSDRFAGLTHDGLKTERYRRSLNCEFNFLNVHGRNFEFDNTGNNDADFSSMDGAQFSNIDQENTGNARNVSLCDGVIRHKGRYGLGSWAHGAVRFKGITIEAQNNDTNGPLVNIQTRDNDTVAIVDLDDLLITYDGEGAPSGVSIGAGLQNSLVKINKTVSSQPLSINASSRKNVAIKDSVFDGESYATMEGAFLFAREDKNFATAGLYSCGFSAGNTSGDTILPHSATITAIAVYISEDPSAGNIEISRRINGSSSALHSFAHTDFTDGRAFKRLEVGDRAHIDAGSVLGCLADFSGATLGSTATPVTVVFYTQ